jgi:hypothetical protein
MTSDQALRLLLDSETVAKRAEGSVRRWRVPIAEASRPVA